MLLALELLRRIPRTSKVSAPELHKQLSGAGVERELRTIQRQLDMLSKHFEIERDDSSKPYGYRWKERSGGLSITTLTEQESLMLTLAEQHLRNLLPAKLMKSMESFFAHARTKLAPLGNAQREREWLRKVRVVSETQPLLPPMIKPGVFDEVSNALYGNRWLNVDYQNAEGKKTKADVMPLGLAQQGPRLYLVCRFEGYETARSLALHRIISAKASTLSFERPADFDLKKFDEDGQFGFGEGKRIRLSFRIDKDACAHLLETPLAADQVVEADGDWLRVQATVIDSAVLDRWLLGFGEQVTQVRKRAVAAMPTPVASALASRA